MFQNMQFSVAPGFYLKGDPLVEDGLNSPKELITYS